MAQEGDLSLTMSTLQVYLTAIPDHRSKVLFTFLHKSQYTDPEEIPLVENEECMTDEPVSGSEYT